MSDQGGFRAVLNDLRPRSRAEQDQLDSTRRTEVAAEASLVLARAADPTLRAVLHLHRPVFDSPGGWPVCQGCDSFDGPDAQPPDWPCRTWTLIAHGLTR